MKRLKTAPLLLSALLLCAIGLAPLLQADLFVYRTLSLTTNRNRGGQHQELFRFSLTFKTNAHSSVSLSTISFGLGQWPNFLRTPLITGSLFLLDGTEETPIASAPPLSPTNIGLILGSPLSFSNNQTRIFLLRGNFFLTPASVTGGWSNTVFAISGSQTGIGQFLTTSPATGITLSNADSSGSGFTNQFRVWDNVVSLSNAYPNVGDHTTLERGERYTLLGISVRNTFFDQSGAVFSLNNLPFHASLTNTLETLSLYLDDGDGSWGTGDDLIGSYRPPGPGISNYSIPLSQPLLLNSATERIIWVRATISPNTATGGGFYLSCTSGNTNFFVQENRIALDKPWTSITSWTNTVEDTTGPGMASGITALAGNTTLFLRWTNPTDLDLESARIVWKTVSYPTNENDGTQHDLSNLQTAIGKTTNTLLSNTPAAGTTYYLCLYLKDSAGNSTLAYSNSFTSTTMYDDAPAVPTGIRITPTRENLEISWDHIPDVDLYGYRIKAFVSQPHDPTIFTYPFVCFTNRITIPKSAFGINAGEYSQYQEYYLGVISVDINGNRSSNDFNTTTEATTLGIFMRYQPFESGGGGGSRVYGNVFRPDNGEFARILVDIPQRTNLIVKIYSISGELMATLANRTIDPGQHEFRWFGKGSGSIVNPGVYIAHVRTGNFNKTHKMIVRR